MTHYGPPSTETLTTETTTVRCHKNSWIYLTSTYYWWLLRPTITIWFNSKKTLFTQHWWVGLLIADCWKFFIVAVCRTSCITCLVTNCTYTNTQAMNLAGAHDCCSFKRKAEVIQMCLVWEAIRWPVWFSQTLPAAANTRQCWRPATRWLKFCHYNNTVAAALGWK